MHVKDIMTRSVESINPTATLTEAAARMRAMEVGMLAVQDGNEIVGVVTDRDLATRGVAQGLDSHRSSINELMTRDLVFCYDDQSVEDAAAIMADSGIRRLMVLDRSKRLQGIISLDDVARAAENPTLVGETLERTVSRSDHMGRPYGRILVALDGSILAEHVLRSVEPLAQKFGSRVTLLRVIMPVQAPQLAEVAAGAVSATQPAAGVSITETLRREAMGYLAGVESRLAHEGLIVESECLEGPPSELILRRARQLNVDLIALTTHGRTGVDRLLLGSVAEDIVRRAPCPVHLVRVQGSR